MSSKANTYHYFLFRIALLLFIASYPMLISIYVFFPLLIGFMGYILVLGIDTMRWHYIIVALIYLVNLEVNLSLPLFLTIVSIILFYLTVYPHLQILKGCKVCVSVLSIIFIDLIYFILLLGYDLVTNSSSIVIDWLLLYSLTVDILLVFLL